MRQNEGKKGTNFQQEVGAVDAANGRQIWKQMAGRRTWRNDGQKMADRSGNRWRQIPASVGAVLGQKLMQIYNRNWCRFGEEVGADLGLNMARIMRRNAGRIQGRSDGQQ